MENMLNKEVSIQIKKHLKNMVNGVKIILFTQKDMSNCVHCDETEKLLSEISELSSKIIVEKKKLDSEEAKEYGIKFTPSFVILNQNNEFNGFVFNGIPAGHEINSFLSALITVSGFKQDFDVAVLERINNIKKPVDIKVFVTVSCPHCPGAVSTAHLLTNKNDYISGAVYDANSFQDLARKFNVSGVPKIVINDSIELLGNQPLEEFLKNIETI